MTSRPPKECADCGVLEGVKKWKKARQCPACWRHQTRFGRTPCCGALPANGICPECPGERKIAVYLVSPTGKERLVYARASMRATRLATAQGVQDGVVIDAKTERHWRRGIACASAFYENLVIPKNRQARVRAIAKRLRSVLAKREMWPKRPASCVVCGKALPRHAGRGRPRLYDSKRCGRVARGD